MPLNDPGCWDFYVSHTLGNMEDVIYAEKLHATLNRLGKTVWMDENMPRRGQAAMEEGVRNSKCMIAVVTDGDGEVGSAYFEHPVCLKELRWAREAGKFIQPVLRVEDKNRMDEFLKGAPTDLQFLGEMDWVYLDRGIIGYWEVGVSMIVERVNNPTAICYTSVDSVDTKVIEDVRELNLLNNVSALAEHQMAEPPPVGDVCKSTSDLSPARKKKTEKKCPTSADGHLQQSDASPTGAPPTPDPPKPPPLTKTLPTTPTLDKKVNKPDLTQQPDVKELADSKDIHGLVQVLRTSNAALKTQAAQALGGLVFNNDSIRNNIVSAGAVEPLMELLSNGNIVGKSTAAYALGTLAFDNPNNQMEIVRAGAVEPLVQLLNTDDHEGRREAARALGRLAWNIRDHQNAIVHAGALEPLVQAANNGDFYEVNAATHALDILEFNNCGNQTMIAQLQAKWSLPLTA